MHFFTLHCIDAAFFKTNRMEYLTHFKGHSKYVHKNRWWVLPKVIWNINLDINFIYLYIWNYQEIFKGTYFSARIEIYKLSKYYKSRQLSRLSIILFLFKYEKFTNVCHNYVSKLTKFAAIDCIYSSPQFFKIYIEH